jgi:hypothetical protein
MPGDTDIPTRLNVSRSYRLQGDGGEHTKTQAHAK